MLIFNLFQVMLDSVGPELQVVNKTENDITLEADDKVILTPDEGQEASSEVLPINFAGLSKVYNAPNLNKSYLFFLVSVFFIL